MGEHFRPSILRGNKTKPLLRAKPLHRTRCHCRSPYPSSEPNPPRSCPLTGTA
jgi:hypothetical protein